MLQLVNSAFFGLSCQVSSPKQAAALIGIDNIKALVLSLHVFSEFETELGQGGTQLWKHSFATAGFAKAIARTQTAARTMIDDAFAAGLLHDVGRLVLASHSDAEYQKALQQTAEKQTTISAVEQELFGCTHGRVGAYLLGLWGLPYTIVEAVAWHHDPAHAAPKAFGPLIAVHAADYCDHQIHSYPCFGEEPVLDETLLSNLGLQDRVPVWLNACQEIHSKGESHV